jgi:carboxyl-terminal processing protease
MTFRLNTTFKIFALTALLQFPCFGLPPIGPPPDTLPLATPPAPDTTLLTTNAALLTPGPNDGRIAYVTARLLEEYHYLQQPLDEEMSKKFFDGYLKELDPQHLQFLQSDIAEFAHYRTNLDTLTINDNGAADLTPAYKIFQRFQERLRQRVAFVDELLKQDNFTFNGKDRVLLDREDAAYPKDLDEAKQLWRQRLRYEYLQEKLNREISPTNSSVVLNLPKSAGTNIVATLQQRYERELRALNERDSTDVLQVYLEALAHAYDPHSDYFNMEHAQDFSIGMSLSLFGIGAELHSADGYCTIASLIAGGPAAKSKQLNENDKIIAVAQGNQPPVDVVDMELTKVVQLIRGPKGTQVRLTIIPADAPNTQRVVSLIRDEIKLEDQEAKAKLIETPDGHGATNRIGVIDVPSFYAPIDSNAKNYISVDVAKLIRKLKAEKAGGIILDLRNNGGGSLEEAIKFVGLFIKSGPVVLSRSPDGAVLVEEDTDPRQLYSGPLVVLVNRLSASASEIAAGALQDYGRALIVGDTSTFGKGTVQNVTPLRPFVWPATPTATNDPGEVKITIRKFYRITGASTQLKGVIPDIILPDVLSYSTEYGESALDNPLPWDTITGVSYDKLNMVQPYLAQLRLRSDVRVATNQDFIYMRQDIDEVKKLQADKTASLNEHVELVKRQEIDARQKAQDREIAARKAPDEKIYDFTLENLNQPGLPSPEPLTTTNYVTLTNAVVIQANSETNHLGTNAVTNASSKAVVKTLPPDPLLDETEKILEDYISLSSSNQTLIAN